MRMCILILGALLAGSGLVGMGGPALAQAPAQPSNAGPVQPWGLPPLPQGVGPVEKFADVGNTPQGKFLEAALSTSRVICGPSGSAAGGSLIFSPTASWSRWSTVTLRKTMARPANRRAP